jgi:hypothetical protein
MSTLKWGLWGAGGRGQRFPPVYRIRLPRLFVVPFLTLGRYCPEMRGGGGAYVRICVLFQCLHVPPVAPALLVYNVGTYTMKRMKVNKLEV